MLAARFKITIEESAVRLTNCHRKLLKIRNNRPHPAADDKIITSWNALTLTAFAEAGRYLNRQDYLDAAVQNATFLLDNLYIRDRLFRSWRAGVARHDAYLEDYASLTLALIDLYQSVHNPMFYSSAIKLADEMVAHFTDPAGGFFDIRDDHEKILFRPKAIQDNATPSGNALAATSLLILAQYGDRPEWRKIAEDMLTSVIEPAIRYPTAFAKWLCAADFAIGPTREVAVVGDNRHQTAALVEVLWENYHPRQVSAVSSFPPLQGSPALLENRPMPNGSPGAYVCQNFICQHPLNSPDDLAAKLGV